MKRQLYFIFSTILLSGGSFFVNYYLSQELTLARYGEFSLIYSLIAIVVPFMMYGQATAMTTIYFSDEKIGSRNIGKEMLTSYKIMSLAFLASSLIILIVWKEFYANDYNIIFISLIIVASLFSSLGSYYQNIIVIFDKYKIYLLVSVICFIVVVFNILLKSTIQGYLTGLIYSSLVLILFGIFLHVRNYHKKLSSKIFTKKELHVLGWVAIPGMLITTLNGYIDRYTLAYYLDMESVAYYSLAATLAIGIGFVFISSILKGSMVSMLDSIQNKDRIRHLSIHSNINIALSIIACVSVFIYFIIGEWLVITIFGVKFQDSIDFIMPLFLTMILTGVVQSYSQPLLQKKKLYILVNISIVVVLINIILNVLLINVIYIKGAIVAMFVAAFSDLILTYYYSKKEFKYLRFPYKVIGLIIVLEFWSLI